jgi:IS30 family transposase
MDGGGWSLDGLRLHETWRRRRSGLDRLRMDRARNGQAMNYYTKNEIQHIVKLKEHGLSYRQIGARLGRTQTSLKTTMSMIQTGKYQFRTDVNRAINDQLVQETENGTLPRTIAKRLGWSSERVMMRLARQGLDAEMRREYS